MVYPRPGYRSRSTPGPTAVDRRRWFGRDRSNGRGIRLDRGTPCFLRVRHAVTVEAPDILLLDRSECDKRGRHRRGVGRTNLGVETKRGGLWRQAVY